MANRRPLVRIGGQTKVIPSGDTVDPAYLSANLTALAALSGANDKGIYFTASGSMAVYDLTIFGRSLTGAADAAAVRGLLELGTAAVRNIGTSGVNVPLLSTANTWSTVQTINSGGTGYVSLNLVRADQGVAGQTDTGLLDIHTGVGALRLLHSSPLGQRWISIPRGGGAPTYYDGSGSYIMWHSKNFVATYTNLTLQSPYIWDTADATDYHQPSYAKVGDVVRLRGKVTLSGTHTSNATVNVTTIATLPVGFRPAKRKAFQVFWDTDSPLFFGYCLVFVNTNGTIVLVTPTSSQPYPFTEGHLPLDQIWFDLAN